MYVRVLACSLYFQSVFDSVLQQWIKWSKIEGTSCQFAEYCEYLFYKIIYFSVNRSESKIYILIIRIEFIMAKQGSDFSIGDFVFAKVKGYRAWPAKVCGNIIKNINSNFKYIDLCYFQVTEINNKKYNVMFYGTREM